MCQCIFETESQNSKTSKTFGQFELWENVGWNQLIEYQVIKCFRISGCSSYRGKGDFDEKAVLELQLNTITSSYWKIELLQVLYYNWTNKEFKIHEINRTGVNIWKNLTIEKIKIHIKSTVTLPQKSIWFLFIWIKQFDALVTWANLNHCSIFIL